MHPLAEGYASADKRERMRNVSRQARDDAYLRMSDPVNKQPITLADKEYFISAIAADTVALSVGLRPHKVMQETAISAVNAIGAKTIIPGAPASYGDECLEVERKGRKVQTLLLRDIFGNPFRPVTFAPAILTWHDGTVVRLAQAIYEERQLPAGTFDPARMNILADALLDPGCDNEEIIQHCRGDMPHVRGCWLIDLLLGKS